MDFYIVFFTTTHLKRRLFLKSKSVPHIVFIDFDISIQFGMKFLLALAFSLALFIAWLRLESVTFAMEQIKNQPPNHSLMSAAPSEFVRSMKIVLISWVTYIIV